MKITVTPIALLFFSALYYESPTALFLTLSAMLFHEAGHLLMASALRLPLARMEFDVFGAQITPALSLPSYRAELLLAMAGPLFSLALGLFLLPVPSARSLALTSFSFALFNCLPVLGFDGGRMLHAALSLLLPPAVAMRTLYVCTYLSLLFLFALSSCMLLRFGEQLSLAVLSATLFVRLFLQE